LYLDRFSKEISEKGEANLRVCHDVPAGTSPPFRKFLLRHTAGRLMRAIARWIYASKLAPHFWKIPFQKTPNQKMLSICQKTAGKTGRSGGSVKPQKRIVKFYGKNY
jgi:hypothetical protein